MAKSKFKNPNYYFFRIAQAGGVGIYAKSNAIYVLRVRPDGSSMQLPFHYKQVLKGTNPSQNVKLQSRDTIVVP